MDLRKPAGVVFESTTAQPVCRRCAAPATYEYKQNDKNPNNPKKSDYSCKEHRNTAINDMWDEIAIGKDTRPILRFKLVDVETFITVPHKAQQHKFNTMVNYTDEREPRCTIHVQSSKDVQITNSQGERVTVHECEAHWVVVTWVPGTGQ